jgi:hypothetical protein
MHRMGWRAKRQPVLLFGEKTMKIRMLACLAGADFVLNRGDITEQYSNAEAQRLIDAGLAEEVKEKADPNAAKLAQFEIDVAALNKQIAERDAKLLDAAGLQTENDDLRKRVAALEAELAAAALQRETDGKGDTGAGG